MAGDESITWAGYDWDVRDSLLWDGSWTATSPGPNLWSNQNVSVVGDNLVLTLANVGGHWCSAEVDCQTHLGYGVYTWVIETDFRTWMPERTTGDIVIGMFTYSDSVNDAHGHNEIDIEYSHWGVDAADGGDLTIHINDNTGNTYETTFDWNNVGPPPYTCKFTWQAGSIHYLITDGDGATVKDWTATGPVGSGSGIPVPADEIPIINLWYFRGDEEDPDMTNPSTSRTVTFSSFTFSASTGTTYTDSRSGALLLGGSKVEQHSGPITYTDAQSGELVLTGSAVEHYQTGASPAYSDVVLAETGLLGYWRLGDASDPITDELDLHPGSTVGNISYGVPGLLSDDADTCMSAPASTNTFVQIDGTWGGGSALSAECWIEARTFREVATTLIGVRSATNQGLFAISLGTDGSLTFYVVDSNGVKTQVATAAGTIDTGNIYHIAGVYSSTGRIELYVNGSSVGGTPDRTPDAGPATSSIAFKLFSMGIQSGGVQNFNGGIDEAALYDVALTADAVVSHYAAGTFRAPPPTPTDNLISNPDFETPLAPDVDIPTAGWSNYINDPWDPVDFEISERSTTWKTTGTYSAHLKTPEFATGNAYTCDFAAVNPDTWNEPTITTVAVVAVQYPPNQTQTPAHINTVWSDGSHYFNLTARTPEDVFTYSAWVLGDWSPDGITVAAWLINTQPPITDPGVTYGLYTIDATAAFGDDTSINPPRTLIKTMADITAAGITVSHGGYGSVTWSPDGTKLITHYEENDGSDAGILLIDVATGALTKIPICAIGSNWTRVRNPRMSPDGTTYAYIQVSTTANPSIRICDTSGGNQTNLTASDTGPEYWERWIYSWSSDSQYIYGTFVDEDTSYDILVQKISITGQITTLYTDPGASWMDGFTGGIAFDETTLITKGTTGIVALDLNEGTPSSSFYNFTIIDGLSVSPLAKELPPVYPNGTGMFPVIAGTEYTFMADMNVVNISESDSLAAWIDWYDESFNTIRSDNSPYLSEGISLGVTVTATAPEGAVWAVPYFEAVYGVNEYIEFYADNAYFGVSTPSLPPTIVPGTAGGLYFAQTYFAGNGFLPIPPTRPPYAAPKQVRIIRELPPTRQVITIETPRGQCFRWASDERIGANIPSGVRNSSTAPGGYEQFDGVLPRDPAVTYADLEPMSTIRAEGVDGSEIGEYRLEATPDTSGEMMSISPAAVGWQNAMNDADAQSLLVIDRDLSRWATQSLQQRQENLRNSPTTWPPSSGLSYAVVGGFDPNPGGSGSAGSLVASLDLPTQAASPTPAEPWQLVESMYDAGAGAVIGQIKFGYKTGGGFGAGWNFNVLLWKTTWQFFDGGAGAWSGATGLSGSGDTTVTAPDTNRGWRRAVLQLYYPGTLTADGTTKIDAGVIDVRVIGAHGLTLYNPSHDDFLIAQANGFTGSEAEYQRMTQGFLASDIVKYIIQNFVPMLTCDDSTIQPSSFIIPQAFYQGMKPGDMVNEALKYGEPTPDWFVWGKRKFYLHDRGARGNHWRARTGPAKLTETGADVTKLFNKIWVKYTDVSGIEVTVGPPPQPGDWCVPDRTYGPGGDVDTFETWLVDNEPDNPLNQLRDHNGNRMIKQGVLVLSSPVGNPDDAAKLGHDFLVQSKQISRAGQATFTGFIEDARTGMLVPYHQAKAGDDVEFVDAADTSARRIQHVDLDDGSRVATVALDSPPDTMAGLLERIGATIIPLGLG